MKTLMTRGLLFGVLFLLLPGLTACNLPASSTPAAISTLSSVEGLWTGSLSDSSSGDSYDVSLVLQQAQDGTSVDGTLTLTSQSNANSQESYELTGEYDGSNIQLQEPQGRTFWGSADSSGMRGQAAWCFKCDPWGEFSLTLQENGPATSNDGLYTIALTDLQDGSTVTPVIAENGLPLVENQVEAKGPFLAYTGLALQADGLWVGYIETNGESSLNAPISWTAWHGNGNYTLSLQAIHPQTSEILATQTLQVEVAGIPEGTLTVKERMIQLYREQFGLNLTAPAFARYTMPYPEAVEASRWISAAYIGNKLYTVEIFDNGFIARMPYDLGTDNGFCLPAGNYSMLVILVDYGNTGLDPAQGVEPLVQWQARANRIWEQYSTSVGLAEPILQIDHLETAIVPAPPVPGQALTNEQIISLTGKNPADFDWLTEIDLDADNSFSGQYGGLGISLNGGCLPSGAQRVNIAFSAIDEDALINSAPGSVFGHELEHGMGWQHWWPNGLGDITGMTTRMDFLMPTLLFGWTDTDGDGTLEILDKSTPYGLTP